MSLMGWVLGALFVWGVSTIVFGRASYPAWKARQSYQWLTLVLLLGLAVVSMKAWQYRLELRYQIAICR